MAESANTTENSLLEIKCGACNAQLQYMPGTTMLGCDYCGAENTIAFKEELIEELDFDVFVAQYETNQANVSTVTVVTCQSCSAQIEMQGNLVAQECDFCGTPLAVKEGSAKSHIKPKSILPFKFSQDAAFKEFSKWVHSLWFAPGDLKRYAGQSADRLHGIYIPYWTYDSDTHSVYTGMRGKHRQQSYTTVENGKTVTRTRTVTDWYPCSGRVHEKFDDVLVVGSHSLPRKLIESLEPWDLQDLVAFDERYLSGFKAECYAVDLKAGFNNAKQKMDSPIRRAVERNIGGDAQQILTLNTTYSAVTFKHILLPIWISAFKYNQKSYRFMINGRTGEVQGERPYSTMKIILFIAMIIGVIAAIILLVMYFTNK